MVEFPGVGQNFPKVKKLLLKGAVIKNVTDWGGRDFVGV